MVYDEQLIQRILDEYDGLRTSAAMDRKRRIREVYSKVPEIEKIDKEINRVGFENTSYILNHPGEAKEANQKLKKTIQNLMAEKKDLLIQYHIPEDFNKYHYQCELCKDTGYIDGKRCNCFQQKLIDAAYAQSNLKNIFEKQNFKSFQFSYYSKEPQTLGEQSPYEHIVAIYDHCVEFVANFGQEEKSLLFYGGPGLGKTFLSSCIAKELIERGYTVIYTRATKLFSMYEDYKFGRGEMRTAEDMIHRVYDADLLIIDDLGTESQNKNTMPFLFDIFNERLANGKKMIISTNYSTAALSKVYSGRFTSRIVEHFIPLHFVGQDIRKKLLEK
jgi:DNA replication protein DnaC